MRIDLHTHSAVSDGTDTPAELVAQAALAGLDVVALTDHDTFDGLPEALAAGQQHGVEVVPGIEISTQVAGQSVHLLGYWCDPADEVLSAELARVRAGRSGRVEQTCRLLALAGVPVTVAEVEAAAAGAPSIGRPHFADALIAKGFVADRREAFDKYLADGGPAYVSRYATPCEKAIAMVHGAGGVAVLAHPWGRGREHVLGAERIEWLTTEHGLDGIEVWHQDHDADARERLTALAARLGLVPTGSSDHHGAGKVDHPLGVNLTPPGSLAALRERAGARSR